MAIDGWLRKEKAVPYTIAGIICLGIVLRGVKLVLAGPLSFDEAWSFWLGEKNFLSLLHVLSTDKHPPLFYLLMHFWNKYVYSEMWIRLPSFFFSVISLFVFLRLAQHIFKKTAYIVLSTFFFAIMPDQVVFSAVARMYALDTLLVLLAVYSFVKILTGENSKWFWINGLVNALMLATHYIGIFVVIAQGLIGIYSSMFRKTLTKKHFRKWLVVQLPYVIVILAGLPFLAKQLTAGGTLSPRWISVMEGVPSKYDLMMQITQLNFFIIKGRSNRILAGYAITLIFLLSAFQREEKISPALRTESEYWFIVLIYLLPVVSFWVISQFHPIFVKRYFVPFQFAYCLLIIRGISTIPFKAIGYGVLLIFFLASGKLSQKAITEPYQESDWKTKSQIIAKNWQDGDVLLIIPPADFIRFKFYAGLQSPYNINRKLYEDLFRNKPNAITDNDLERVLLNPTFPYHRIWFHEEVKTGLSADFYLQKEGTILSFLERHFAEKKKYRFEDVRGTLRLFVISQKDSSETAPHNSNGHEQ